MKKLTLLFLLSLGLSSFKFLSGDCGSLLFFKEGTSTTMATYNDDGKLTGTVKTLYTAVSKTPSGLSVKAQQESFDKKGKSAYKADYTIRCEKGILLFDMKMMMPDQQSDTYKDFEMTMEGNEKEIPSDFVVGSSLKDSNIKFKFKTKEGMEMAMMNMAVKISNRKVATKESVTTSAGTFDCYKITEDMEIKTLFTTKMKTTTWFNMEVGTVKSETYKDNGKFKGRTELTAINR